MLREGDTGFVVVLTAQLLEYKAVRAQLTDLRRSAHREGTGFEVGYLRGSPMRIALARTGGGNAPTAVLAERAITMFAPQALLFVGVAGSLVPEVELGDVVVATRIYAPHGGVEEFGEVLAWPRAFEAPHELLDLAEHLAITRAWRSPAMDAVPDDFTLHFQPIAAGEVVLNSPDTPLMQQLRLHYNDAVAIEMESIGAAQAAHLNRSLPALTVRGISDMADGNIYTTADGRQLFAAATNAAVFAFGLIREWAGTTVRSERVSSRRWAVEANSVRPARDFDERDHDAVNTVQRSVPAGHATDGWASNELARLARAATVAIGDAADGEMRTLWGSGVLVAPGWVATCAHVFEQQGRRRGDGEEIGVEVSGRLLRGRVAYTGGPARGGRQHPDLALVALLDCEAEQQVAWLGERDPLMCENARMYGYQATDYGLTSGGRTADPVDSRCRLSGRRGVLAALTGVSLPRHEHSGGPLVDCDRGEVVGIVAARQGPGLDLVVPLDELRRLRPEHRLRAAPDLGSEPWQELLRRHDRWHLEQQDLAERAAATWIDVRRRIPGQAGSWSPVDRLEELGWLSRLMPPTRAGQVESAMPALGGRALEDWPWPLHTWRDGYARLGDRQVDHLNFLMRVRHEVDATERRIHGTVSGATAGLAEWIRRRRRELDLDERTAVPPIERLAQSVLVEIEPVIGYGQHSETESYRWTISRGYGAGEWVLTQVGDDWARLSLTDAVGQVRDVLGDVLSFADGKSFPARLEIAVPVERVLPSAHNWRTAHGLQGTDREVVVRHSPRRGARDDIWTEQWHRVRTAERLRAHPIATLKDVDGLVGGDVPVFCRHGDALSATITNGLLTRGHAIAFWRAAGGEPEQCVGTCTGFCARVSAWLVSQSANDLPEKLRQLRKRAHGNRGPEHDWVRDLVLLFDDPRNPLPGALPPEGGGEYGAK